MKSLTKFFGFVAIAFFATAIFSCSNFTSDEQFVQSKFVQSKTGAYLTFAPNISRTVLPDTENTTLSNFVLKGLKDGESEQQALGSWATKAAMQSAIIPIEVGDWVFTLSAESLGTKFEGTINKTIVLGENRLFFALEISNEGSGIGSFEINLSFENADNADSIAYAIASFENFDGSPVDGVENQRLIPKNKTVTFTASNIAAGTYRARVKFYSQEFEVGSYRELVQISSGLRSVATRTIESFDNLYTITYILNGGSFASGITVPETFSRKSVVTLPTDIVRANCKFMGWHTDASFSSQSKIDKIENIAWDITVYASYAQKYATVGEIETWNLEETSSAILAATGNITVTLYEGVVADDIGKSGYVIDEASGNLFQSSVETGTIAGAIANTSADSVALVVDGAANIKLNANSSFVFAGCSKLCSVDLQGFDTSKAENMRGLFAGCSGLFALDICNFDTALVKDMNCMFNSCSNLEVIYAGDKFVTNAVTTSENMFYGSEKLVGQAGTTYDAAKDNAAYARVDSGSSAPGYFCDSDIKVCADKDGKGIRFSVNRHPAAWNGKEINNFIIYCFDDSGKQFLCVYPKLDGNSERLECLYPLCAAGERCSFVIQIECSLGESVQNRIIRNFKVTSKGGLGGLDFSSITGSCLAKYNELGKPEFDISFAGYPSVLRVSQTCADVFAIGNDIDCSHCFQELALNGKQDAIVVEDVEEFNSNFLEHSCDGARTRFFAEAYVVFDIDSSATESTIAEFQSCRFDSNAVDMRMPASIEVVVKPSSDISVTKTQSGNNVIFTAENCDSYCWTLDDKVIGTSKSCTIDATTLVSGTYSLALEAIKGSRQYSYWAQLKCESAGGGQSTGNEPLLGDDFDQKLFVADRLQTTHCKVENVSGGLKFTITRPNENLYNPNYLVREEDSYEWVGEGNGDYAHDGWKYVGAGKGDHAATYDTYDDVGAGNGDYVGDVFIKVAQGNGDYALKNGKYTNVGGGNGNYYIDIEHEKLYVGSGKGYMNRGSLGGYNYAFVGSGNGDYIYDGTGFKFSNGGYYKKLAYYNYEWAGFGNGDYIMQAVYVGAGNGDRKQTKNCIYVGDGAGDYTETFKPVAQGSGSYVKRKIYGGFGWAAIARCEYINGELKYWTTTAELPAWEWKEGNEFTCFYPLCKPDKRYVFLVCLEPVDADNHKELQKNEYVSVVAKEGVGDIDYSNLGDSSRLDLNINGTKPIATLLNFNPSETIKDFPSSFSSVIQYFGVKNGFSYCFWSGEEQGFVSKFDKDYWSGGFKNLVESKGFDQIYALTFLKFTVEKARGISAFRTIAMSSNVVDINQ